jgi:hypothetical protein
MLLSSLKTGTAPIHTLEVCIDAAPHTVPSTNAGAVSHPWRVSSTSLWRRRCERAPLSLCALPGSGADLLLFDRGNIYCARGCAEEARRSAQRAASERYQSSYRGRLNHAERARNYRARQKNVTHQGSPPQPTDDLISEGTAITPSTARSRRSPRCFLRESPWRCHWCGCRCPPFVRNSFLRRRRGADP